MTTASYYESNIYHRVESRENLSWMSYFREEKALVVSVPSKICKAMSSQGWAVVPQQCRDGRSSPANPEVGTATQSRGIVETGEKFCETNRIREKIRWTVPSRDSRHAFPAGRTGPRPKIARLSRLVTCPSLCPAI